MASMVSPSSASFPTSKRFSYLGPLGSGAAGAVHAARDCETGAHVALKVLHEINSETLLLLKNEFRSVAEIHHPNLVRLGELVEDGGNWFITMELVDGIDMLAYVRPSSTSWQGAGKPARVSDGASDDVSDHALPPLDEARLRLVLPQLLEALRTLHNAGKVHCDVKPSNVLVTREGRVVLLDFGIVNDWKRRTGHAAPAMLGTPDYMSPEQVLGEELAPASDLYSVGVFLYLALTGRLPFAGSDQDVLEDKITCLPQTPDAAAPSDLAQLCMELLQTEPAARTSMSDALARLGAIPSATARFAEDDFFVGRCEELAFLQQAFVESRAGRAVTVVLEGESGIGKSHLARELVKRCQAQTETLIVLQGKCYEQESVPYKGLDGVIDELSRTLANLEPELMSELLPPDIALLKALFPVLEHVKAIARAKSSGPEGSPQEQRNRAVDALGELLTRLATRFAVVMVIEDLHWANHDSIQLLSDLLKPSGAPPFLLVITRRPRSAQGSGSVDALRAVNALRPVTMQDGALLPGDLRVLALGSLPSHDARELTERLLASGGDAQRRAEIVQTVTFEARGHPLFIRELTQGGATGSLSQTGAPLRLDDAICERVRALSSDSRTTVEIVCLAGLPLRQELLAKTQSVSLPRIGELLAQLRAEHLVRGSGVRSSDVVEPYHDRVRESVVGQLSEARRRHLHGLLAQALDLAGQVPADVLATHWERAGESARALGATLRAADAAASAFAFDYAAALYRRALKHNAHDADDVSLRQTVWERLGDALRNAGRGSEAALAYERAAESAPQGHALQLRRRAAEQLMTSGKFDEGRAAFKRVLDDERVRIAWTPMGSVAMGLLRRAWIRLRGLGYHARDEGDVDVDILRKMDVLWDALRGLCLLDATLLFDLSARLTLLALGAGEPRRLGRFLCVEAMSVAAGGNMQRGQSLLDIAAALISASDNHSLGMHRMGQALVDFYSNHWPRALEETEQTAQLFRQSGGGVAWETAVIQQFGLIAMFRAGELTTLREASRSLYEDAERRGDLFGMTSYAVGYPTLVHLVYDTPDEGRRVVARIMERWTENAFLYQHYQAFIYELSADLYAADHAGAWARVERIWPRMERTLLLWFPEIAHEAYHLRARAALAHATSLAAGSAQRRALLRTARASADKLRRRAVPWPKANAELIYAGIAALDGKPERAALHLGKARHLYTQVTSMPLYAHATQRALGVLTGGDTGRELVREAEAGLHAADVQNPARFAAVLACGFAER